MKTKLTFILALLLGAICIAQSGINYKAVIRDASGNIVSNDFILIQFSILESSSPVFTEIHTPTTDANGLVILNIGTGTPTQGSYNNVNWNGDSHSLNVKINAGNGLVDLGTTEFNEVPYAISAEKASNMGLEDLIDVVGPPANGEVLKFNGVNWEPEAESGLWSLNGEEAFYSGTNKRVGIGVTDPEDFSELHVGGDLFIQSDLGSLVMGSPNNGDRWQFSTENQGATLNLQSKLSGSSTNTTQFKFEQTGEFKIGDITTEDAWLHIRNTDTDETGKRHILIEDEGNGPAIMAFKNTSVASSEWLIIGTPSATESSARLLFNTRNGFNTNFNFAVTGDGKIGVNISNPSARLHIAQEGPFLEQGIKFTNQTGNQPWQITHGGNLSFHYGNTLRGHINSSNGAYVQGSDSKLKENVKALNPILNKVLKLDIKRYNYISDSLKKPTIGVIAQDAKEIFPEVVHYSEPYDTYGVNYSGLSVIAIKAIQEQQEEIDDLKARLEALEQKMK